MSSPRCFIDCLVASIAGLSKGFIYAIGRYMHINCNGHGLRCSFDYSKHYERSNEVMDLLCSVLFATCIGILALVVPVNLNHFDVHSYYQQIIRGIKSHKRMSLRAKSEFTRKSCLREMPEMIDILILGLSSGLSFDSALDLYCLRESGELSRELSNAHMTWKLGATTREEALNQMAAKVGVPSLKSFATVVNEALTFGTPLAEILDRQASVLRDEQRSLLETEIEKIPIKMLIPLGTLIVPAMLLAILGPLLGPAFSS